MEVIAILVNLVTVVFSAGMVYARVNDLLKRIERIESMIDLVLTKRYDKD